MIDKNLLEELYFKQGKTQKEIGKILNVSQAYISAQFIKLGIKARRLWPKEDLDYLEDKFGELDIKRIAKHLEKTPEAILIKARRLGLESITNASDRLNSKQLARVVGTDRKTIVRWINKHGLEASRKVLVKKRAFWRIKIEDFWKWAEKHQELIKWSKFERNALGKEPKWVDAARKKHLLKPKREDEKWTTKENESLRMYWNLGKKPNEIAEILNRSSKAVLKRASRIGLSKRKIKIPWQSIEVETLIKMKLEGYTDTQVAEELGRGVEGVTYRRRKLIEEGKLEWEYRKATKNPDQSVQSSISNNSPSLYHMQGGIQVVS